MDEMMTPNRPGESSRESERRDTKRKGLSTLGGVPVRDDDVEPVKGLHSIAILFRIMAGMLVLLMALQVVSGLTSMVEISYGVLLAEAIRLVIFAGLLWGVGDLADLFVKSHHDVRAARILLERLTRLTDQTPAAHGAPPPRQGDADLGRGDGPH
jgi:hypothetical protein